MEENITGVTGEASVGVADQQSTVDTASVDTTQSSNTQSQSQVNTESESVPDGSKPSKAWETYRKKAEMADKYQAMIEKVEKRGLLPDGFNSFEEFINSQPDEETHTQSQQPDTEYNTVNDQQTPDIKSIVKQTLAEQLAQEKKQQEENMFLYKSLEQVAEKYPEYKGDDGLCDISKLPQDELVLFYQALRSGSRKDNLLLNLVRGSRYDIDTAKAKQEGESKAAAHVKSVAHTTQVVGNTAPAPVEHVEISPALRKNFELAGIRDPAKMREYASKFQGTTNYKGTYNAPR